MQVLVGKKWGTKYVEEFSRELQHIVTRYGSACFTSNTIASPYQNGLVVFHALQT